MSDSEAGDGGVVAPVNVLKALTTKRAVIKSKLTLFDKYLGRFTGLPIEDIERSKLIELKQRFSNAEALFSLFDEIQIEIECEAVDLEQQLFEREAFENKYYDILARGQPAPQPVQSVSPLSDAIKLPEIKLPKFDGSYELWMEFRDIFESLIHTNAQISNIQKFHYLRASLVGSAPQVIQSLEFTSNNYVLAWNTLCERFNNNQLLIQNHLKAIFNSEPITNATAFKIRLLYENLYKHLNCLKQLGEPVDSWDTLLIYILSSKLDKYTAQEWEKYKANISNANLEVFKDFLKNRANILETIDMNFNDKRDDRGLYLRGHDKRKHESAGNNRSRGLVGNTVVPESPNEKTKYVCFNCKRDHSLFSCQDFLKMSVKDRLAKVKSLQLCLNCLRRNHQAKDCSWSGCKLCGSKHNTILHQNVETTQVNTGATRETNSDTAENPYDFNAKTNTINCSLTTTQNAILSTAKVRVGGGGDIGKYLTARALLDCGSQSSFITRDLCDKLKLTKNEVELAVSGISGKLSFSNYKCNLNLQSINNPYSFELSCFVLDKITSDIPDSQIDILSLNIPVNIKLADPDFFIPEKVDILIGADFFWQLLSVGRINLGQNSPILQNTRLGWVVAGPMAIPVTRSHCNLSRNISVQDQLAKFWEVEEIYNRKPWSFDEQLCEEHFAANVLKSESGRFIVTLPLKDSPSKLGESREIAIKRFLSLEKRLLSNNKMRELYSDFLNEYEKLGHMSEVADLNNDNKPEYYMPHHGVLKESSTTTKLRVVFNASSPTSTGVSLNDLQMTGPIIQQDLLSIILRFRMRALVLSSDIRMMYRQVLVNPEQRSLQRIVWRANPNDPIKTFELNTVTYGTTSASFLAIRCLEQIASECEAEHPIIANIIRTDMYVDDLLTGVDTKAEAEYVCQTISEILLKYGFDLRKWKSNDKNVLLGLNTEINANLVEFAANKEGEYKTLGLVWESNRDLLTFKINCDTNVISKPITKRVMLSKIASIFDPLGLLSPCIIIAKVLLQKLWSEKLTWDQVLPEHILNSWLNFSSELDSLNSLLISRKVTCNEPTKIILHGFSDASETSYGACVYVVSENARGAKAAHLLCSKSKVAPIKTLSVPRLELCAALILSQLISKVVKTIAYSFNEIFCWSDSMIVLGWLKTTPSSLKPFVANRVSEIQNITHSFHWKHVATTDNPADIVSRGLNPKQLIKSQMWFHGPKWLLLESCEWPSISMTPCELPESRNLSSVSSQLKHKISFPFNNFSQLPRLKRAFAYIIRFITNCKSKSETRIMSKFLTADEINESFSRLVKIAQIESFAEDYFTLQKTQSLSSSSQILSLHPFIDDAGILRVGGRLTNSDYPYNKKFPILLSPKHHLTQLLFEFEHKRLFHAGPQLLLSTIRESFWPINGRNMAKKIVRNCVKCARYDVKRIQPMMGNLPEARIRPTTPFTVVGVDYAGPFILKNRRGRGCQSIKCWVALFICFTTRAIHLELVLSLSADDFIQAFKRFIGRRGKPIEVYSDNGTNFVRANKDMMEMGQFLQNKSDFICESTANMGIKWHFIPVNSPHFGGLWEAGVKSLKHHLKRILGNNLLFFFDFQTLLIQIEGILNSRPLFPSSSNPDDLSALSPAHFLIGRNLVSLPEQPLYSTPDNRLSQYQLIQKMYEHFWNRWSKEFIGELQLRRCWKKSSNQQLELGQLVLIKDDNSPPTKWRMGRVLKLIFGKDNIARVALLKTSDGTTTRALVRLCPLPVASYFCQGRGHVCARTINTPCSPTTLNSRFQGLTIGLTDDTTGQDEREASQSSIDEESVGHSRRSRRQAPCNHRALH